ncbi:hypothetical protein [Streptacidiphilus neutrinimicus]|uniref:hypothetical protein n=1 Tax=Streptacidiphilus neutrinimicus TaxID=105420 RepID=UPI00126A1C80|nr:hypothetical protein [Streptacidiphilus neutrinimicus]
MFSAVRRPAAQVAAVALCASVLLGATAPAFADAPRSSSTHTVALPNMVVGQDNNSSTSSPAPSATPAPKKDNTTAKISGFVALLVAGVGGGLFISWSRSRRRRQS